MVDKRKLSKRSTTLPLEPVSITSSVDTGNPGDGMDAFAGSFIEYTRTSRPVEPVVTSRTTATTSVACAGLRIGLQIEKARKIMASVYNAFILALPFDFCFYPE